MQALGHQRVSMDGNLEQPGGFTQPTQKSRVVVDITEDRLTVDAALDDVVRLIGNDESRKSGHDQIKALNRTKFSLRADKFSADPAPQRGRSDMDIMGIAPRCFLQLEFNHVALVRSVMYRGRALVIRAAENGGTDIGLGR